MVDKNNYHESVLVEETVNGLHIEKERNYIDATLGNGGHALEILNRGGRVLGIDLDPKMLAIARTRLEKAYPTAKSLGGAHFKLALGNFSDIDKIAKENDWTDVYGILLDLGVSNIHLKDLERGFSFANAEAGLDMRLDPESQGVKAADLLNVLREDQLIEMFAVTMDPGSARWITGRVIHSRNLAPIANVGDMLEICQGLRTAKPGLNEATLPFLALRIAVNSELDNLKTALPKAYDLIVPGGRLVVISFHSGEDAIVKDFFKEKVEKGSQMLTFKPITAGEIELSKNKRARSARMRVLQK